MKKKEMKLDDVSTKNKYKMNWIFSLYDYRSMIYYSWTFMTALTESYNADDMLVEVELSCLNSFLYHLFVQHYFCLANLHQ